MASSTSSPSSRFETVRRTKFSAGDNNYLYAEVDYNQPLVEKKLLLRFMGSWLDSDGWQKFLA